MSDKQHITVQLDAHAISLNVDREKEPIFREAGKMLNECYRTYQKMYPNLSAEQIWVHVALHVGVNLQSDAREKNMQPIRNKLDELNQLILQKLESTPARKP